MNLLVNKSVILKLNANLKLREVCEEDCGFLTNSYRDKEIQNLALGEENMEIKEADIHKTIQYFLTSDNHLFIIEFDNIPIGMTMLYGFSKEEFSTKIGIVILRQYQNFGMGKEIVKAVINYAFSVLKIKKITGEVYEFNDRPKYILEELNFRIEQTLQNHLCMKGEMFDMYLYSLFNDQYVQV